MSAARISVWLLGGLGVAALLTCIVFLLVFPRRHAASNVVVHATPALVERGRYLVRNVATCLGCHSAYYTDRVMAPVIPGTEGQGGYPFTEQWGVPGLVNAQNITSDPVYGIGKWTDGEVIRAFREGIDRNGRALFPMMPYQHYARMSDADALAVVAYLRTLPPIAHAIASRRLPLPVEQIIKTLPAPVKTPIATPDRGSDAEGYAKYLVDMAACVECHTPHDEHNRLVVGKEFSGGWPIRGPWGTVVSANISPDPETFVGRVTREGFIRRFKSFAAYDSETAPRTPYNQTTIMPWLHYSHLSEDDLGLIYDFLRRQPPIRHAVDPFPLAGTRQ
jgi:mono/diheme cytochrome c family protein